MRPCTPSLSHYGLPAAAAIAREPFPGSRGFTARVKGFRRRLAAPLPAVRIARQSRFQDLQQIRFVRTLTAAWSAAWGDRLHAAVQIRIEQRRVDVRLAADRFGVAERSGDGLDRSEHVALALCERAEFRVLLERSQREQGTRPGAKILRREIAAADLAQIVVDVGRADALGLACVVEVREQFLPRKIAAAAHDRGE